jgi:S-DNA-T family DNA segregation ATPase FtsK/SpoIIIE
MLHKERHLNKGLIDYYPDHKAEYERLVADITKIRENDPGRYKHIYRYYNPRLAEETYGKDTSKEINEFLELLQQAKRLIKKYNIASTAFLQRQMSLNYSTAVRLIEELELQGLVGNADGAKAREIYL